MNVAGNSIEVENLSKFYTLLYLGRDRRGLRHVINDAFTKPFRKTAAAQPASKEQFWALRDVCFSVKQGETVGVVGRNGAGKSTLLKILSRITEPTAGRIRIRGRIASLLEVGTGFHPELTGRENVYLNGAILGMTRAEIKAKFDEIVAFAEVERFLDTPVKRYSSGMYVRLAFAVAAHLEPEILVIDEVLAVGDAQFQKKCLGKMEEVARSHGRTIFFVSHNMGAVSQLCRRGILLENGRVALDADAETVVARYLSGGTSGSGAKILATDLEERRRHRKFFFHSAVLLNHLGQPSQDVDVRFPFTVQMEYEIPQPLRRAELSVRISTAEGRAVMTSLRSEQSPENLEQEKRGLYRASVKFPGMFLMPGSYVVTVSAHEPNGETFDAHEGVLGFLVRDTGTVFTPYQHFSSIGVVMQSLPWDETQLAEPSARQE
jgi:lipopolysaccharide transport system ATP-binding protein